MLGLEGVHAIIATPDKETVKAATRAFPHHRVAPTVAELENQILRPENYPEADRPDFLVLDIEMPELDGVSVLKALRERSDDVPVLILTSLAGLEDAVPPIASIQPGTDFLVKPVQWKELVTRARILLDREHAPAMDPPIPHLVKDLHESTSGRLDANAVAMFFGLTTAELARLLRRGVSTVHKTPTSLALQEPLRLFESIASGLLRLTGSKQTSKMWLHALNPALEGHAPVELLRLGKIRELAEFVQDLLEGRPA
jgi:DNA-binding response OmpR family regulator